MKKDLQDKIYAAAPKLYLKKPSETDKERFSARQLARLYGPVQFDVSDGWFDLLMSLSIKLEAMDGIDSVHVVQVKEKFGGLRFYVNSATSAMYEIIMEAEVNSYKICEVCGNPGELRRGRWIQTLCDKHAEPDDG